MDLLTHLVLCGGAARLRDLDPGQKADVNHAVRAHAVVIHAGRVAALPDAPPGLVHAVALRGVLCDLSAAVYWGIAVLTAPTLTTVAVPRQASRRRLPDTEPLRRYLSPADVDERVPVTRPLRTVLDCIRNQPFIPALVVANSAANLRLVFPDQVLLGARALKGPGSTAARSVARLIEPRCESVLETLLYVLLRQLGLPFELQAQIDGVGRVDALVAGWLVIEADGFTHHSSRQDYREDRRRANRLAANGYVLVRLSYEDLVFQRARTLRMLREVVANGRSRP